MRYDKEACLILSLDIVFAQILKSSFCDASELHKRSDSVLCLVNFWKLFKSEHLIKCLFASKHFEPPTESCQLFQYDTLTQWLFKQWNDFVTDDLHLFDRLKKIVSLFTQFIFTCQIIESLEFYLELVFDHLDSLELIKGSYQILMHSVFWLRWRSLDEHVF